STGDMRLIDLDTGAVRSQRRLRLGPPPSVDVPPASNITVSQTAGVGFAGHKTPATPLMSGFDAPNLTMLWSRPVFPDSIVAACGAVFCMYDTNVGTGVNPRTGATEPFPGCQAVVERGLPSPDIGAGAVRQNTREALIPEGAKPDHNGEYPGATALVAV